MICSVVFPERRPRALGFFDYHVPNTLQSQVKPGQLVSVPFRSSTKEGVIWSIHEHSSVPAHKLKHIISITHTEPVLRSEQRALAEWLAKETLSSLATTVRAFLPDKPKRATYPLSGEKIKRISKHQSHTDIHTCDTVSQAIEITTKLAANLRNKTICVIVPDLTWLSVLNHTLSDAVQFSGSQSATKTFSNWSAVFTGAAPLCVGTRNALYLPFPHLDHIIIFKEEDINYQRQEQHPDFDTLRIAKKLATIYDASLSLISFAPRVDSLIQVPPSKHYIHTEPTSRIHIIDKKVFHQKRQSSVLPDDLLDFYTTQPGPHALLFNKKGRFRSISCSDCSFTPTCATCGSAFIHELSHKGLARCAVCKTTAPLPDECPHCGSPHIRGTSPGITFLQEKIVHHLNRNKTVKVLSKDEPKPIHAKGADIILGTDFMLPLLPWAQLTSFTVLDIDTSLDYPDFRASEWTLQRLRNIHAHLLSSATFFIVTASPTHEVFTCLLNKKIVQFLMQEANMRKSLSYPPYSEMIACTLQRTAAQPKKKLASFLERLDTYKTRGVNSLTVLQLPQTSPAYSGTEKLILRVHPDDSNVLMEHLHADAQEWNITRNPLDLFRA